MSPHFAGKLAPLVLPITIFILGATSCLILGALLRRRQREKYFEKLDEARSRYKPLVKELLSGARDYDEGLRALIGITGPQRMEMLERLCLEDAPKAADLPILRRLCQDLGLIEMWRHNLAGASRTPLGGRAPGYAVSRVARFSFLVRARSAENLRLIRDQLSWPLL